MSKELMKKGKYWKALSAKKPFSLLYLMATLHHLYVSVCKKATLIDFNFQVILLLYIPRLFCFPDQMKISPVLSRATFRQWTVLGSHCVCPANSPALRPEGPGIRDSAATGLAFTSAQCKQNKRIKSRIIVLKVTKAKRIISLVSDIDILAII